MFHEGFDDISEGLSAESQELLSSSEAELSVWGQ